MNKQQLASKIWESANEMRSKIDANEYKDYILGFIFYKYLSNKLEENLLNEGFLKEDFKTELVETSLDLVKYCQRNYGYFISYNNLFQTWLSKGSDFDVSNVRDALSAFDRLISKTHEKVYKEIFETLQTGLSNLGSTASEQTKAISKLIHLIDEIPMTGKQDYDVLGFIYEYLISMFAASAGKKAGEFYTPHEVSILMSEIVAYHLRNKNEITIYDPTSGSGSLLINIGKSVAKHMNNKDNIKYYAQELKKNTYNLTRMNLVMRGIKPDNIVTRNADTLEQDWPMIDENGVYNHLQVDAVVSNPPYSQKWNPENKENDPRYNEYGVAPKSKADYAFLLHDLFHVKDDGLMTIVLPHGVLFRGGSEGEIRKNLIEKDKIDTIIGLPANIFFGTGIPTIIMVLKPVRKNNDILIIDASKGFIKDGNKNKLRSSDIRKIVDTVINRRTVDKFSRVVSKDEIRENEYNLNIPRYVDSNEEAETWDIYASMNGGIPNSEIDELNKYWTLFPTLKSKLFIPLNDKYSKLTDKDLNEVISNDESVKKYREEFNKTFNNFDKYLVDRLINNMSDLTISSEKQVITDELFSRLKNNGLVDRYDAYQLLDDIWNTIELDLETIHIDGKVSLNKVEPNMVSKKKGGETVEVQEGYIGKIIPFEIAQQRYFLKELDLIETKENRINELSSLVEELFENLTEEDKDLDVINEDKTAFVNDEVLKYVKQLPKKISSDEEEIDTTLRQVNEELIEGLPMEDLYKLLEDKWVNPIVNSINSLVEKNLNNFNNEVNTLANKYSKTLHDIESEIKETSKELVSLLEELDGDEYSLKGINELIDLLKGE
jgi:type I restriction enzyme M protein